MAIITGWSLFLSHPKIIAAFSSSVPDFDVYEGYLRISIS
jgi:hypothetical protein